MNRVGTPETPLRAVTLPIPEEEWYGEARRFLDYLKFVPFRNGWLQNGEVYAYIDHPESPKHQRYVGFFRHRLDDKGDDVMVPVALIPWYGDGEPRRMALQMVASVANQLIHGIIGP